MRVQFPAFDERDGFTCEVRARDRAEAIRLARRVFADAGHGGPASGRKTIRAKRVEATS